MSKDFKDIVGSRTITVNVFQDDDEVAITLRLLEAVMDDFKDRKTELTDEEGIQD